MLRVGKSDLTNKNQVLTIHIDTLSADNPKLSNIYLLS